MSHPSRQSINDPARKLAILLLEHLTTARARARLLQMRVHDEDIRDQGVIDVQFTQAISQLDSARSNLKNALGLMGLIRDDEFDL